MLSVEYHSLVVSAADNTVSGEWSIYTNDKVFSDGCAVAFFYTDKPMANVYTGAYHETTNSGVITKIEGKRTLVEIDGVPAMKKYAEWTGKKLKDLDGGNLLSQTILAPLGVKDRLGDLVCNSPSNEWKQRLFNEYRKQLSSKYSSYSNGSNC